MPIAPPMVRANWFMAVAAPRRSQGTLFWITISSGAEMSPMPAPMTSEAAPSQSVPDAPAGGPMASIAVASTSTAAPPITSRW